MNLIFIQKSGVDLYSILYTSETSRGILKFYRPVRLDYGVLIENMTLGSSLSLISEISWYVKRYMTEVLLELSPDLFCSHAFSTDIYTRNSKLKETWDYAKIIGIKNGEVLDELWISPHSSIEDYPKFCEAMDSVLEVWCSENEWKAAENDGLIAVPDEMKASDADSPDTEISDAESEENDSEGNYSKENVSEDGGSSDTDHPDTKSPDTELSNTKLSDSELSDTDSKKI
ncbi:MAG: hypothetical protein II893_00765 [Methanomicrobium sp.]|nr:hypothetical protein [Methanomicrobium sp.]